MLRGLITLVLFQGIGEAIAHTSGVPIPGAVIGMLLLFVVLQFSGRELPTWLGEAGHFMIRWLSLLFVPACVGFFFMPAIDANQWLAVVGVIVAATLITMAVTALLMKWLIKQASDTGSSNHD